MNLIVAVCNAVLNCRQWRISENGIAFIPGAVTGGIVFRGEWSSSVSDYKTNDLVFISTGPAAGSAIATQNVPAGTSPEMGAPYWVYFPVPPPGNWST